MLTRCAGTCDEDTNRCLCGPSSRFPERPMMHCRYEGVERDMPWQTPNWAGFAKGPKSSFWSADAGSSGAARRRGAHGIAWCDADPELAQSPAIRCKCYDGQDDKRLCAPIAARSVDATFCPNQCHGRAECLSGYCRCEAGWYGADCSISAEPRTQPRTDTTAGGDAGISRAGASAALLPPRPRIYVYELPGDYNTFLLARRQSNDACAIRTYTRDGGVKWTSTLYGAEVALHESLLASPHRVLDPAVADFFYVPVYGGCFISEFNRPSPRHWLCDECHKGKAADLASLRALRWHTSLLHYLSHTFPYWNASGGADHLWPFTHDEGACYAPAALSNATLLVHWGRTHLRPNGSSEYHLWRVKPHAKRMYGWERCYDACKDLVLPSWRAPDQLLASDALFPRAVASADAAAAEPPPPATREATFLFYFNGVLGTGGTRTTGGGDLANYSFGLRQQLYSLFGGMRRRGVVVTDVKTPSYAAELSRSTFCGVLPGWGWSGRMEDAVLHGCIPVILQDGIETPWEGVLDARAYSLRVKRDDMPRLLDILRAVPPAEVARMQAALRRVWPRFSYLSVATRELRRRASRASSTPRGGPFPGGARDAAADAAAEEAATRDAVATLIQSLRVRLMRRLARRAGREAEPAPGCVRARRDSAISNDVGSATAVEVGFEGRVVNGWTI